MEKYYKKAAEDTSSMMIWLDNRIKDVETDILSEVRPQDRDLVRSYIERLKDLIVTKNVEVLIGEMKKACK